VFSGPILSTILVVDDDPDTRFMFRLILEHAGHAVIEATDGKAAMDLIDPDLLPDMITTDLTMPILNGEGLIERLRSKPRTASIPIVVVSANPDAARALQDAGLVEAVVIKPFDPVALEACIRNVAGDRARAAYPGSQLV
jgi:two-component system, chemotaxis family, chemotaxis protein CheY